jgi:hypothetical protein
VLFELGPALRAFLRISADARRATKRLSDELDALPGTPHPLGTLMYLRWLIDQLLAVRAAERRSSGRVAVSLRPGLWG